MRYFLNRLGATLYSAMAFLGLFTVTGVPGSLRKDLVASFGAAATIQVYLEFRRRRQSRRRSE